MNKSFFRWGLITALTLLMFSCHKTADTHQNLIPKDADFVLAIKSAQIAEKAKLSSEENIKLFREFADEIYDQKNKKEFIDFINNPERSGIDFEAPIYLFSSFPEEGSDLSFFGISFRCNDEIEESLSEESEMQFDKELAGFKIYKDQDDRDFVLAIRGEEGLALVFLNQKSEEKLQKILEQTKENSFASTKTFAKINETQEDIELVLNYSSILKLYTQQKAFTEAPAQKEILELMKQGASLKALYYTLGINAEKGALKVIGDIYSEDQKTQKIIEDFSKNVPNSKNKFFDFIPKNSLFSFNLSIHGASVWRQIQKLHPNAFPNTQKQYEELSEAIDIELEDIFKALEGDFTGALSGSLIDFEQKNIDFRIYLEMGNKETVIKIINKVIEDKDIESIKTGENQYLIDTEVPIRFGIKDDVFFFTTKRLDSVDELFEEVNPNIKESRYADQLLNKRASMLIDVAKIVNMTKPFMGFVLPAELINRLEEIDYLSFSNTDKLTQAEILLKLKNDKNPYALLLDLIREIE